MRPLNQAGKVGVRATKEWLKSDDGQRVIREVLARTLQKNENDKNLLHIDLKDLHVPVTI